MAINRLIVDEKVHDEFVDRFVDRVRSLKVGDPREPDTAVGPVITDQQLQPMVSIIKVRGEDEALRMANDTITGSRRRSSRATSSAGMSSRNACRPA